MKFYSFFILSVFTFLFQGLLYCQVINVSTQEDFGKLLNNNKITVIKFYTTWCGACNASEQPFLEISESPDAINAQFIAIDIDKAEDISQKYDIEFIPQFFIFKDGKLVKKQKLRSFETFKQDLIKIIEDLSNGKVPEAPISHESASPSQPSFFNKLFELIMFPINFLLHLFEKIISMVKGLFV